MSTWFFEGSCFVVKDLRAEFDKIISPGFPHGWRGKGNNPWEPGPREIYGAVYHQTYGSISPGEEGPLRTARFEVANPWFKCPKCSHVWEGTTAYPYTGCPKCGTIGKNTGRGRGFPKMSYQAFVPFRPRMSGPKPIVYYCVDFMERVWHGGNANAHYIGIGFQGMFKSRHIKRFRGHKGTDGQPSDLQKPIIAAMWHEWIKPLYGLTDDQLKGHYDFGKKPCPGDYIENEIRLIQGKDALPGYRTSSDPPPDYDQSSEWFDTWHERQAALYEMGYDLGDYGPKKNGVDGDPGDATRAALEGFQGDAGIEVTGFWDDETEKAMQDALEDNGLKYDDYAKHLPDDERRSAPPAEKRPAKAETFEEAADPPEEPPKTSPKAAKKKKRKKK
jgi:hypothetical protein